MRKPAFPIIKVKLSIMLMALLFSGSFAYSQTAPANPVETLRQILKDSDRDPGTRDRKLKEIIPSLEGINDLHRALLLREWRDQDPEENWATIDRPHRAMVERNFRQATRAILERGDETSRLAVLNLLANLSASARAGSVNSPSARDFATDLVALTRHGNTILKTAAARTLGLIDPRPEIAAPAFEQMLAAKEAAERVAAADGLFNWMQAVCERSARNSNLTSTQEQRKTLVQVGCTVIPLAGRALNDTEAHVRRRGLQVIGKVAEALQRLVAAAPLPGEDEDRVHLQLHMEQERTDLLPLIQGLKTQAQALTGFLADPNPEVLALARRALEDMTHAQLLLLERAARAAQAQRSSGSSPAGPFVLTSSSKDPLVQGLHGIVLTLAGGLGDKDARARRAVIDVLESLGPAAAPAATALVGALADSDPFVRWSAARTLGKISPAAAATAVPALVKLLDDQDLDLRLAAVMALERYGPAAKGAVGALIESAKSTEAELRVSALRALGSIGGPEAHQAIPVLRASLADSDVRVRRSAAEVLGKFGPAAREAEDALRKTLHDQNTDVQKAAGEALLRIKRPGSK